MGTLSVLPWNYLAALASPCLWHLARQHLCIEWLGCSDKVFLLQIHPLSLWLVAITQSSFQRQSCVMWLHTHKVKWATCGHRESGNSSCSMDCGWIFCSPISQAMSYNKRNNAINANIRTQPKRPFTHFRTLKTFLDTDVVSLRYSLLRVGNV
jgi:hypothetical protein